MKSRTAILFYFSYYISTIKELYLHSIKIYNDEFYYNIIKFYYIIIVYNYKEAIFQILIFVSKKERNCPKKRFEYDFDNPIIIK